VENQAKFGPWAPPEIIGGEKKHNGNTQLFKSIHKIFKKKIDKLYMCIQCPEMPRFIGYAFLRAVQLQATAMRSQAEQQ